MGLPKYVKLNNSALRLKGKEYYRDAGIWGVGYKIVEGVLLSWCPNKNMPWLHNKPLVEITEEEWREDNLGYVENVSSVNEKQEVSYNDIEKLTLEVKDFIKSKGFDIIDEFEFLTKLEKVMYEGIDKYYE